MRHKASKARRQGAPPSRFRLYRRANGFRIGGVCGGLADYLGIGVGAVRVAVVLGLVFFSATTVIAYVALWMLLPTAPEGLFATDEDERFWRDARTEPAGTLAGLGNRMRQIDRRMRALETVVTSPGFRMDRELRTPPPRI
jgi:phage shock protein C